MTMTESANATPAPAEPASVPIETMSPEQARENIRAKIHDPEFGKKLLAKDPAATAEWQGLHRVGWPAQRAISSTEDVNNQQAARNAEGWDQYLSWLRTQWAVTPENEAEIRGGVIRQEWRDWAQERKALLIKDKGFYRRLMDGDRAAKEEWGRVTAMLALRPVKP